IDKRGRLAFPERHSEEIGSTLNAVAPIPHHAAMISRISLRSSGLLAAAREHVERGTPEWRCCSIQGNRTMIVRFFDQQDESNPLNGSIITDTEQLSRVLDSLRSRKPFLAQLFGDNGYNLMVGIGGTIGCVQHSRSDGNSPYLVAAAPNPIAEEGDIVFWGGNTATPVSKRYILPFEKVKEIAGYFLETGARSAKVHWEEI